MSGAMAMIGMVWLATMSGTSARSRTRTWTSTMASASPSIEPRAKPMAALRSVNSAARTAARAVVRRLRPGRRTRIAMSQMWGSFTSVANANVSGGSWSIAIPVPRNESRCASGRRR